MAALDVANASVLEFDLDAAPTRTHVPGHGFDVVADRRRILDTFGQRPPPVFEACRHSCSGRPGFGQGPANVHSFAKGVNRIFQTDVEKGSALSCQSIRLRSAPPAR